ncbi:MAG: hypothetical protein KAS07_00350 [Candidatus Pacebacteria bacterium]|nr:hypothetical protein [Candidatus Paceibacterota bacterium]
MNTLTMIDVDYVRANRTIETIQLSNNDSAKTFFIFNYEGKHFRVFENEGDAYKSASGNTYTKALAEFVKENKLDKFLENTIL